MRAPHGYGEMAEWSNAAVLKTADRSRGPGVRIPLSPHNAINLKMAGLSCCFFMIYNM